MADFERNSKVCYRCGYFIRYYTKGFYNFKIQKIGFCKKHQNITESKNCCNCWQSNHRILLADKKRSMKVLTDLLMNIAAIRQILQEEREETEND